MRKTAIRFMIVLIVVLSAAITGFVVWAQTTNPIMPQAEAALTSDAAVTVTPADWITFMPTGDAPTQGVILYPGGRVQAEAYAPLARALAEQGVLAVIVRAPLNLAFFGVGRASPVIDAHPGVAQWVVGGHSLGGVAAGLFAQDNLDRVDGLVIMASYPANDVLRDVSPDDLRVISVYGTLDGLASEDAVLASAANLHPSAQFIPIVGGNHAYFGWYGAQAGDNEASISRDDFTAQLTAAILDLLDTLATQADG